jgi:hypothetical protein
MLDFGSARKLSVGISSMAAEGKMNTAVAKGAIQRVINMTDISFNSIENILKQDLEVIRDQVQSPYNTLKSLRLNHFGVRVDSNEPCPGIFQNNDAEWLYDEFDHALNLTHWEHKQEHKCDDECDFETDGSTWLVGYKFIKSKNIWVVDKKAPWSAIIDCDQWYHTTVMHSKWFYRGELCSPCCPGQVSIGEPGRFLCYAPDPEVFSEDSDIAKAIFMKGDKK